MNETLATPSWRPANGLEALIAVLVPGLLSSATLVSESCRSALLAIGSPAVVWLHRAAAEPSVRACLKKRAISLAAAINASSGCGDESAPRLIREALMECIRTGESNLPEMATRILRSISSDVRNEFIREAVTCAAKPDESIRFLTAAGRLHDPVAWQERRDLHVLTLSVNGRLKAEAKRLLVSVGPLFPVL